MPRARRAEEHPAFPPFVPEGYRTFVLLREGDPYNEGAARRWMAMRARALALQELGAARAVVEGDLLMVMLPAARGGDEAVWRSLVESRVPTATAMTVTDSDRIASRLVAAAREAHAEDAAGMAVLEDGAKRLFMRYVIVEGERHGDEEAREGHGAGDPWERGPRRRRARPGA